MKLSIASIGFWATVGLMVLGTTVAAPYEHSNSDSKVERLASKIIGADSVQNIKKAVSDVGNASRNLYAALCGRPVASGTGVRHHQLSTTSDSSRTSHNHQSLINLEFALRKNRYTINLIDPEDEFGGFYQAYTLVPGTSDYEFYQQMINDPDVKRALLDSPKKPNIYSYHPKDPSDRQVLNYYGLLKPTD